MTVEEEEEEEEEERSTVRLGQSIPGRRLLVLSSFTIHPSSPGLQLCVLRY
jgi:hypothetical protein